jgi:hypothetical protein
VPIINPAFAFLGRDGQERRDILLHTQYLGGGKSVVRRDMVAALAEVWLIGV